jgi:hypothetical protein
MQEEPVALLPARAVPVRQPQLEAGQERRGLGGLTRVEADPDFLVERFHERHLSIFVPLGEGGAEALQRVVPYGRHQRCKQLESARDLADDCPAQTCPRRLGQVELEQARLLWFRRLTLEERLDPAVIRRPRTEPLPVQLLERAQCRTERRRRLCRLLVLGHHVHESRNGLGTGHGRLEIGHEHLRIDQLLDEVLGLLERDPIADQRGRQLVRRRACARALQHCLELVGVVDGDKVIRAERPVEPRLGVPEPPSGAVKARVRPEGKPAPDARVILERSREGGQVVHIEACVPAVAAALLELEAGSLAELAEAAAGEEPERSGPARGSLKVRDERRERLPRVRAPPRVERAEELGGSEIEGLAELRALVRLAQATLELCPVRPFCPGVELVERQQRCAQDEEAGGDVVATEAHGDGLENSMTERVRCRPLASRAGRRALPAVVSPTRSRCLFASLTHDRLGRKRWALVDPRVGAVRSTRGSVPLVGTGRFRARSREKAASGTTS